MTVHYVTGTSTRDQLYARVFPKQTSQSISHALKNQTAQVPSNAMSDLASILPSFAPSSPAAAHLLAAIEAHSLTTADLLSLDALDISRRLGSSSRSSVLDIKRLVTDVVANLHGDITRSSNSKPLDFITTGDKVLDALFGGGIPTRCITEFVGESGTGKSQFLLLLTLTAQLPTHRGGLARTAVYISTEAPLSTKRLVQLSDSLTSLYPDSPPSTDRVFSITCNDLETQEHIIRYQLPVMVEKFNVGLIVIDSIAANFRAEFGRSVSKWPQGPGTPLVESGPAQMARRGKDLVKLAQILRGLASKHNAAVVVANQVSDRFGQDCSGGGSGSAMGFDFQARWFNGWGEDGNDEDAKVPSLGLVWANLLAARVVLKKNNYGEAGEWRRCVKVVFAPWAESGVECQFEIVDGGVRAIVGNKG